MTTAIQKHQQDDLVAVLQSSLYPGAAIESVRMVLDYCRAAKLDPLQKPVHLVPLWDQKAKQMRDVVMPGIGLYRIQAARTGEFLEMSEPEFGPERTETIGGVQVTYPEWCRVTVKRFLSGIGREATYTVREYWRENYAARGGAEKSVAPNAMWMKRPFGQLAKCATAQALRAAFPELGAQPTAEEMEGKAIDAVADEAPGFDASALIDAIAEATTLRELRAAYESAWSTAPEEARRAITEAVEKRREELRAGTQAAPEQAPAVEFEE